MRMVDSGVRRNSYSAQRSCRRSTCLVSSADVVNCLAMFEPATLGSDILRVMSNNGYLQIAYTRVDY